MQIGPFTLARTKSLPLLQPLSGSGAGWWPIIRESFTGAWQQNVEIHPDTVLAFSAVYACISLIAGDMAKLGLRLVEQDAEGIWNPVDVAAFSPVLRKPNRWQTRIKFVEQWMVSKLARGNTYVLKERDGRGIVRALYILDPSRVTPLVSPGGDVYYELRRDDLSGLPRETLTVPAREIIHDVMCPLFHPLIGVTPIFACGLAATQGLSIQRNSSRFFANMSKPGGILTAPGVITDETASRLKTFWETNFGGDNIGRVAVAGDGLTYEALSVNAVDAQLIEQLKWTAETVCSCFHVQPYMISVGPPPPYANVEPLLQQYYAQALQMPIECLELLLDEGLELGKVEGHTYGTEFDLDDLFRMDTATRADAAQKAISSGGLSPDEARFKYFDKGKVKGGSGPYMQQQMWPLEQLAAREVPGTVPPPPPIVPAPDLTKDFTIALRRKAMEAGLAA